MKTIEFIIPLFNEVENIRLFQATLSSALEKYSQERFIFTYIDDGSTDQSWKEISKLADLNDDVQGMRFSRNFGKEYAMEAGLKQSKADAAIVIDADLQHPISIIPSMIEAWKCENYKVVSGVKIVRQRESWFRSIVSNSYYSLFSKISGLDLRQMTDFKLLDREVIDAYLSLPEGARFFRGLISWLGYKEKKIEFTPLDRMHGTSSWSLKQLYRYASGTLISFSYIPLKITSYLSLGMLMFALFLAIQSLYNKMTGNAEEGFTTVLITQLIIGCSIMFGLSNIGTYIAKIYDEIKSRPHYIIAETTGRTRDIKG